MQYRLDIDIDRPRQEVIEAMDNSDNMVHWMDGLVGYEHMSGTPGRPGAKMKLKYKMGKREFDMIETVLTRNFPDEFSATYETDSGRSFVNNTFEILEGGRTRWISDNTFECDGLIMKIMSVLMPGAFKKHSRKMMANFKAFVEQ